MNWRWIASQILYVEYFARGKIWGSRPIKYREEKVFYSHILACFFISTNFNQFPQNGHPLKIGR